MRRVLVCLSVHSSMRSLPSTNISWPFLTRFPKFSAGLPRVDVLLVVRDRGRDNRLTTQGVSAFGIVGEVSGYVDCVDVHYGDLGFWVVLGSTFYVLLCYM